MRLLKVFRRCRGPLVGGDPVVRAFVGARASLAEAIQERLGAAEALTTVIDPAADLFDAVALALRIAYLDGIADAQAEDADDLVDGRTRAERATSAAEAAVALVTPLISLLGERADSLRGEAGLLWGTLSTFVAELELDPEAAVTSRRFAEAVPRLNVLAAMQPAVTVDAAREQLWESLRALVAAEEVAA